MKPLVLSRYNPCSQRECLGNADKQIPYSAIQEFAQRVNCIEVDSLGRFFVKTRHSAPGQTCPSRHVRDPELSLSHQYRETALDHSLPTILFI